MSENIYGKYEGNAFLNKEFAAFIKSSGIDEIEVIGVDGGGCVALIAIDDIK